MKSGWLFETSALKTKETQVLFTQRASAAILINDGAKTLTRNVQSNEKINNISVYVTVYASVASKTRILKTATHRHAQMRMCFFYWTRKKRLMRRLFGTCGGAWESNDYFFLALVDYQTELWGKYLVTGDWSQFSPPSTNQQHLWHLSLFLKFLPLRSVFRLGNGEKSKGDKSEEYRGWGRPSKLHLVTAAIATWKVWPCKILCQTLFFWYQFIARL